MDNKTIYVVTSGDYSDYHIDGVFDVPALAERLRNALYNGRVEPWELNKLHSKIALGYKYYRVYMDTEGRVFENVMTDIHDVDRETDAPYNGWGPITVWKFFIWATDEKHAVKIANERRVQLIASNLWEPEPDKP